MKRFFLLIAALALALALCGCAGTGSPTETLPEDILGALSGETVPPVTSPDSSGLAVSTRTVEFYPSPSVSARLTYPTVTGISPAVDAKLNAALASRAEAELAARVQPEDALAAVGATAEYTVTSAQITHVGENFACAVSFVTVTYTSTDPETHAPVTDSIFYAYSSFLNLSTGEEVPPTAVLADVGAFFDLLAAGEFRVTGGEPCANLSDLIAEARTNAAHGVYPPMFISGTDLTAVFFSGDGEAASLFTVPLESLTQHQNIPKK